MESSTMKAITNQTMKVLSTSSCRVSSERLKMATWQLISSDFELDIMNTYCDLYYACTAHNLELKTMIFQEPQKRTNDGVLVSRDEAKTFVRIYVSFHMLLGDINELLHHGLSTFENSPLKDMTAYLVYGEEYVRMLFQDIISRRIVPAYQLFLTKVPKEFPKVTYGSSEYYYMVTVHNYLSSRSIAGNSHKFSINDHVIIRTAEEHLMWYNSQYYKKSSTEDKNQSGSS
uniref:P27 n=8 Tax=European mountain ash ringspot-associated virus (isolate Sorbus aucuparia) TaxID=1980426 RepID=A0A4U8YVU6_EMARV|nr:P27 [European mountain ash ringspot-associated virus]